MENSQKRGDRKKTVRQRKEIAVRQKDRENQNHKS